MQIHTAPHTPTVTAQRTARAAFPSPPKDSAPWNLTLATIESELHATESGLSSAEAVARLAEYGPNLLRPRRRRMFLWEFLSRFRNPRVLILLAASGVSALTGEVTSFFIISGIVLMSVTLDFVQEHRAGQAAERLQQSVAVHTTVLRDGTAKDLPVSEIVPGDVVLLSAGDLIPADARVLEARDFFVKQALLTGEPYPVEQSKNNARENSNARWKSKNRNSSANVASWKNCNDDGRRTDLDSHDAHNQHGGKTMAITVGINGFGRTGRLVYKALRRYYDEHIDVVAINDLGSLETLMYLLKYDTNYGHFPGDITLTVDGFEASGQAMKVFSEKDPSQIPWGKLGIDIVVESSGHFTQADKAKAHLAAGAKKVVISAPAKGEDVTIVLGVNEQVYNPASHHILSNASCTTNGLAPVAKVLLDTFGIEKGLLTTVHAYTNSQRLLDLEAKDPRDARAAAMNIVTSETGAARAVGLVIPALKGKFNGMAFRVPVSTVSVIDFTAVLSRDATAEAINACMKNAATGPMKGILSYTEAPLVSSDLKGDPHSSILQCDGHPRDWWQPGESHCLV